jgi:hypothetical protein
MPPTSPMWWILHPTFLCGVLEDFIAGDWTILDLEARSPNAYWRTGEPKVSGLSAGGNWIRNFGSAMPRRHQQRERLCLPKIVSGLAQMPRSAILALGCLTS